MTSGPYRRKDAYPLLLLRGECLEAHWPKLMDAVMVICLKQGRSRATLPEADMDAISLEKYVMICPGGVLDPCPFVTD